MDSTDRGGRCDLEPCGFAPKVDSSYPSSGGNCADGLAGSYPPEPHRAFGGDRGDRLDCSPGMDPSDGGSGRDLDPGRLATDMHTSFGGGAWGDRDANDGTT